MEEALRSRLLATTGVTSLVGQQVYWGAAPQGVTGGYIILHRVGGSWDQALDGATGLIESRIQVDAWGATYKAAKDASRAALASLQGYRTTTFRHIAVESERDDHDLDPPNPLYRTSLDLRVWHKA